MIKKLSAFIILSALLSAFTLNAFAGQTEKDFALSAQKNALSWLDGELSKLDLDYPDNRIDWISFAFASCGYKSGFDYKAYAQSVLSDGFSSLYSGDIARIALALEANGIDSTKIGGINLIEYIASYDKFSLDDKTNSAAYALILLNCKDFENTDNAKNALAEILIGSQFEDGGYSYSLSSAPYGTDVDTTAAVIIALAPYRDKSDRAKACIEKALGYIKANIGQNGMISSWGADSVESTCMAITALCTLGIDPTHETWQVNGKNMVEAIKSRVSESGGIQTTVYDADYNSRLDTDILATYEAVIALQSYIRFTNKELSVYNLRKADNKNDAPPTIGESYADKQEPIKDMEPPVENNAPKDINATQTGDTGASAAVFAAALSLAAAAFTKKKREI